MMIGVLMMKRRRKKRRSRGKMMNGIKDVQRERNGDNFLLLLAYFNE